MHSSLFRKQINDRYSSHRSDSDSSCPSTPPMSTTWFEPPLIDICSMTNEHRQQVVDLVINTFFRDEPLNKCLAFDIPDEPIEFTELIVSLTLNDQCSFVAIDMQTNKVIGVILNVIKHRSSATSVDRLDENNFQSEKLRYIIDVLKYVHRHVDLFTEMNTDRLLHIVVVAIDAHYRGLRLTEKLIHASIERAKHVLNLTGAFAEATSLYSSKAFRKQDFNIYEEIIYAQYDGIRLAGLNGEHDRCQLLAKKFDESNKQILSQ
jgi:ribosomal protein S18 acetylase RimI-like enzyme